MADTQEQIQYDKDFAQLNATPKSSIGTAAWNQLKKAFDVKYPTGRPGSTITPTPTPTPNPTPDKGIAPGTAWIYDEATKKWVQPVKPVKGNKTFTWDDNKGWVESGVNTTGLTVGIGFVLTKALLDDPVYGKGKGGLQEVYDLWAAGDETAALDAYFKSNYYLKLGKTTAARYTTSKNQPEVYAADEGAYISGQKNRLFKLGVRIDDAELIDLLKKAYAGNLTDTQLDSSIALSNTFGGKFGGTILGSIQDFKNLARSYGLSYTEAKYNQWGADLFANKITDTEIEEAIKTESASKYPAFADQIMKGVSMDALASSYKSSMASILSLDADSIGYDDPTLNKALQYIGADGKPATMPLWQFETDLRSDPRWQFTDNARDSIDSMQYRVMKDWGLM